MRSRVAASACCSAHELADPQRRRGLGGEVVEQLAVVGGVLLLGEPRPEVEHADQLALADERHRELDARRLELGERRRVELERLDVDGAARALQVGEQRVVRRDVDRRGLVAAPAAGRGLGARRSSCGSAPQARGGRCGSGRSSHGPFYGPASGNRYGRRAEPERHVGGLHRLARRRRAGRPASASSSTWSRSRAPNASSVRVRVVAAAVEAAVDDRLHPRARPGGTAPRRRASRRRSPGSSRSRATSADCSSTSAEVGARRASPSARRRRACG